VVIVTAADNRPGTAAVVGGRGSAAQCRKGIVPTAHGPFTRPCGCPQLERGSLCMACECGAYADRIIFQGLPAALCAGQSPFVQNSQTVRSFDLHFAFATLLVNPTLYHHWSRVEGHGQSKRFQGATRVRPEITGFLFKLAVVLLMLSGLIAPTQVWFFCDLCGNELACTVHARSTQVGDACGIQSPLSFGGFGALTRHLRRLTNALTEALEVEALDKQSLGLIHA
jgi:hypothetical protein